MINRCQSAGLAVISPQDNHESTLTQEHLSLLQDFILSLDSVTSLKDCFELYRGCVESLGFSGLTYTFVPRVPRGAEIRNAAPPKPIDFLKSSAVNTAFMEEYNTCLAPHDFALARVMAGLVTPMNWREYEKSGSLNVAQKNVIKTARGYKIRNAVTIPTMPAMTAKIAIAGASVFSEDKDDTFNLLLKEKGALLQVLTQRFHETTYARAWLNKKFIEPLIKIGDKPDEITQEDREVIYRLAHGESSRSLSDTMEIPYSTLRKRVNRAAALYGCNTAEEFFELIGELRLLG